MKPHSLTSKILWAAFAASFFTALLVAAISYAVMAYSPRLFLNHDLNSNAEQIAHGVSFDASGVPVSVTLNKNLAAAFDALKDDMLYRILDGQGRVILASSQPATALAPEGQAFDPKLARFDLPGNGGRLHIATLRLERPGQPYYVQIGRSDRFQGVMQRNNGNKASKGALAASLAALLIFSGIVFYIFRRLLKPLHDISQQAARISPANLRARLSTAGIPSELAPLIVAFNAALERLERGYQVQQEFLVTAAHELKTPLALMRGTVELGASADRDTLLTDLDRMSRQVQQLLQLAECSEVQNYAMQPVDAIDVIEDAASHLARLASNRAVVIDTRMSSTPCIITADRSALFVLVRNILENAVQHAPAASVVEVMLDASGLSVRDRGIGITAQDLPLLFRRFWRGAHKGEEGSGLGLSICHQIAQAHGWTLTARDAAPGACFLLAFGARLDAPIRTIDGS